MKYAFLVYRKWAFDILKGLVGKIDISNIIVPQDVPAEADFLSLGVPVSTINPRLKNLKDYYATFKDVDVFLLLGWSWLIDHESVDSFRFIGMHPSPLPRYRGGSPIQNQIIAGETTSAIAVMDITHDIDDGPIYPPMTPFSLEGDRLNDVLANMVNACTWTLLQILPILEDITPEPQDESKVLNLLRRVPDDSEMFESDFETARTAYNKIRCLEDPFPNAFLKLGQWSVKLTNAKLDGGQGAINYEWLLQADATHLRPPLRVLCKDKSVVRIGGLSLEG